MNSKPRLHTALALAAVLLPLSGLQAAPEDDRTDLWQRYRTVFPDLPRDDFVFGALALRPDARMQYDAIMEFPPFVGVLDAGRAAWERPFRNGRHYGDCFPEEGRNVAGNYPRYDAARDRVVTFEKALNDCRVANGEAPLSHADMKTMGVLTAWARTLSDGMRMNVAVEGPGALAKYEAGKRYFFERRGPLNFSCAVCHVQLAGKTLRTELLSPAIGQATHWPVFRGGDNLNTIQARYKRCLEQIRVAPPALGGEEFDNLEYFHAYISNGLPLQASVYRK